MAKAKAPPEFREYLRKLGQKGGKARLTTMTAEERSDVARRAGLKSAEARARKKAAADKKKPAA